MRLAVCPAVCLSASGAFTPGFGSRPGFALRFWLRLGSRLGFRPALPPRRPVLPYVWEREKLSFLPLLLDPGNFLLSQAVPSSVPSAFGGLTSVFGMGTGGALQLSSPETFRREASLSLPLPAPSKLHSNRVDPQTFTLPNLLPSLPFALSTASALSSFLRFFRLLLDGLPSQIKPSTD